MSDKVVIEVRINEYAPRTPNPHVPYSPEEIAADARACREQGASIIHYHARDPESGAPCVDPAARTVQGLEAYLPFLPAGRRWHWSVLCFGGDLFPIARGALERGGHIAIGVGDHPYAELGCPTNAELVARVARLAREIGREVANPAEARAMLL